MFNSRTVTVSIRRSPAEVAEFVSNPENLSAWLTFITGVRCTAGQWFLDTPGGPLGIQFVPPNGFGVLDHRVTLPDGTQVMNPMRVVPNQAGSEVIFTLLQIAGMSDDDFARDAATVEVDLQMLKQVLERS